MKTYVVPFAGKPDVSTVVYRVGECMQELIKSWKEYESQADKMGESSQNGPTLEIRIPAEHVTATNRQVRLKYMSCFVMVQSKCWFFLIKRKV